MTEARTAAGKRQQRWPVGRASEIAPGEWRWGREGEILACPWHGWEFDLLTGQALADPRDRLRLYPVTVEDGTVFVLL